MKLRKPKPTKAMVGYKGNKKKEVMRPTSYHEISIPDTYIEKVGWSKGEELSIRATTHRGNKILIIENVDRQSMEMEFFTGSN